MATYRVARQGEERKLLDLANLTFSISERPTDFRSLVPKVYARDDFAPMHVVAEEEEALVAMAGLHVFPLRVGQDKLMIGFVGTVCAHPYEREKGHMKHLMNMLPELARKKGCDLLVLGGQRQRYNYYDFEVGGVTANFTVTAANLKHAAEIGTLPKLRFVPIEEIEQEQLEEIYGLYLGKKMIGERSIEDFALTLKTWKGSGYAVLTDEELGGYIYQNEGDWKEFGLKKTFGLLEVLAAWQGFAGKRETDVVVQMHQMQALRSLSLSAEYTAFTNQHMLKVLNWQNTLQTLLRFKAQLQKLPEGKATISIEGHPIYSISVHKGKIDVKATPNKPQLMLTQKAAVLRFFSVQGQLFDQGAMPDGWTPLFFSVPEADCF